MSLAQQKQKRIQDYFKFCNSDKGKKAREKAIKKYYEKNKKRTIKKKIKICREIIKYQVVDKNTNKSMNISLEEMRDIQKNNNRLKIMISFD
tara:strand:+ start:58 stop:333 length:276 start_codon:yes stop_codon:yes gene_type:complete